MPASRPTRRRLKNDSDARMVHIVEAAAAWLPEKDIQTLDRSNLPYYIAKLREAETRTRQLRKRLEALQAGVERPCPACGRPVQGRADAVYCSTNCRVRSHRENGGSEGDPLTSAWRSVASTSI
jgi:hypothetical protein